MRSFNGPDGGWYRRATSTGRGHITAGGVDRDVAFQPAIVEAEQVDQAYRDKYGRSAYLPPMISTAAAASTLRLVPDS